MLMILDTNIILAPGYHMALQETINQAVCQSPTLFSADTTGNHSFHELDRLAEAVRQKRPDKTKIILQHDNAKPHTAKLTKAKIQELGWEVLPHSPYSPDIAPSDYQGPTSYP